MDIRLFDFHLPIELIAQSPSEKRDGSRLLVYHRKTQTILHKKFHEIQEFLKPNDILIRNNTKVIPARLFGTKEATNASVELLLLDDLSHGQYRCLVGNAKVVKEGTVLTFGRGELKATCLKVEADGARIFQFHFQGIFLEVLSHLGTVPLPPYIKQQLKDPSRYQTVYAKVPGSAAAPTAGFHFTEALIQNLTEQGIRFVDVTLQIGLGTFKPVKVEKTEDHVMHEERYEIDDNASNTLNTAKANGQRLIAVGTTATRTLESNWQKYGKFQSEKAKTNIFITPGYAFQTINGLITNFHLPKSTLVMMVSALVGRETLLRIYQEAIEQKYRFFSFGDAMLIL
ncbi:MAG: tRNA preQ1(34) S-adenosylmethionine ribosyltransferase-isomerase QueA [Bacilli bacterium]